MNRGSLFSTIEHIELASARPQRPTPPPVRRTASPRPEVPTLRAKAEQLFRPKPSAAPAPAPKADLSRPVLTASAKLRAALDAKQAAREQAERAAAEAERAKKAKAAKPVAPQRPVSEVLVRLGENGGTAKTAKMPKLPEVPAAAKKRRRRAGRAGKITDVLANRELLAERFPLCFAPKEVAEKRPLKIGIYHDIRARLPELSGRRVTAALHDYTTGPKYWTALVAGAVRIDLDGNPAGVVSADEADHARTLWPRS